MDIHIRTKVRYGRFHVGITEAHNCSFVSCIYPCSTDYSYVESAALRIGDDILEVGSFGQHFLNGVDAAIDEIEAAISGFPITHKVVGKKQVFTVDLGADGAIVLDSMKDIVSVQIIPGEQGWSPDGRMGSWFGDSAGLVGGLHNGNMMARNGTVLVDANAMGQEWQVRDR